MQEYGIHKLPDDEAIHVLDGRNKYLAGYTILTLIDVQNAGTPLDAAKQHIGEQRGKVTIIDSAEEIEPGVLKVMYHRE